MPDIQDQFTAALLNADLPVPDGLVNPDGTAASKRFDVYRNNVIVSLIEALRQAYPVVEKSVGTRFFDAMAGVYVRAYPPRSPLMMFYGEAFPDFLRGFEPARAVPYLPDIALLERARRDVYHAADETPIAPDAMAALDAEALQAVRMEFIPATRIVTSTFPILGIWQFNMVENSPQPAPVGEDVLIARPADRVVMHRLSPGSATFLGDMQKGACLADAAERSAELVPEFDLSVSLGDIFAARILKQIKTT